MRPDRHAQIPLSGRSFKSNDQVAPKLFRRYFIIAICISGQASACQATEIELLKRWIDAGASWPETDYFCLGPDTKDCDR